VEDDEQESDEIKKRQCEMNKRVGRNKKTREAETSSGQSGQKPVEEDEVKKMNERVSECACEGGSKVNRKGRKETAKI
jgi:hypothetical protein